jgi:glycerol uptake facilitator protein
MSDIARASSTVDILNTPVVNYTNIDNTRNSYNMLEENKSNYKLFFSEMLGMTVFITLSLSNVAIFGLMNSKMAWEGVAIAWGFNLLLGIKTASSSGGKAYLNPCIAFADCFVKNSISVYELGIYVLAELTGAFAGAGITYGLHRNLYKNLEEDNICGYFATYNADGINKLQSFFVEFIGTLLFSTCIFMILKSNIKHAEYAISMSLTAVVLSLGFQTAFSYNWARDFGPRLFITTINDNCFSKNDNYWFIPLIANFLGAFVGAILSVI